MLLHISLALFALVGAVSLQGGRSFVHTPLPERLTISATRLVDNATIYNGSNVASSREHAVVHIGPEKIRKTTNHHISKDLVAVQRLRKIGRAIRRSLPQVMRLHIDDASKEGRSITNSEHIQQWPPEKPSSLAAICVVLVFGFIWIAMAKVEDGLEKSAHGVNDQVSPSRTTMRWRSIENTNNVFMPPDEEEFLQTKSNLRKLRFAAIATGMLMVVILIIGHAIGSLSLCGEGIHLIGDTMSYFGLFLATVASQWETSVRFTYGLGRVELLCVLLVVAVQYHEALFISFEAYERFWHPTPLKKNSGELITCLSCLSMIVNIGIMVMMSRSSGGISCGHSHGDLAVNMALIHIACDIGQNVIVLIAGVVLWHWPRFYIIDPICVIFFLALLLLSTLPRIREIVLVLIEASPENLDCAQLCRDLADIKGVKHVRKFHAWCITPGKVVVTAHVYVNEEEPMDVLQHADTILKHKYGIQEFTLQVCDDDPI